MFEKKKLQSGFTLIESLIATAIFVLLLVTVYQTTSAIIRQTKDYRENTTISALADQYMEIARNLPYSALGTISGNPHGNLPDLPNATTTVVNGTTYQVYYAVTYVDDSADGTILAGTDFAANDYKQIKLYIKNTSSGTTNSFFSNIVPKGLENLDSGGALFIKVFDAIGQPVPNATVEITNTSLSPAIDLIRTTDADGNWIEVGLPNSANAYHITATKTGYSEDATSPITETNPNPTKPDATISNGQVTQISFSIDKTSNLVFKTLNQSCVAAPGVALRVQGAKLIGTPDVLKFDHSYTSDAAGKVSLSNIEWDTYTPSLVSTATYMIYGSSPIQEITILPGVSQTFNMILGPKTDNSLLAIVKDAATGNPIQGATVELTNSGLSYDSSKITSGSTWSQSAFEGGSGQENFSDETKYFEDDGNVNTTDLPSGIRLAHSGGVVTALSGTLTSSSFDTGTASTSFTTLTFAPASQDPATSAEFQIATNNDNATWNFVGPDGTADTKYSISGSTINPIHNNNRYIRYKLFLNTTDASINPVITSVNINYVSGCFTPGQAMFAGMSADSNYQLSVSMPGYLTNTVSSLNISGYNTLEVLLTAQ